MDKKSKEKETKSLYNYVLNTFIISSEKASRTYKRKITHKKLQAENHTMDIKQTFQSTSKSERKPLMSSQSICKKFAERNRIMVQQESSLVVAHMMAKKARDFRVHHGPPEYHHDLIVNAVMKANEGCVPTDDESIDDLPDDVPRTIVFETPTSGQSLCSSQESKLQQEQSHTENRRRKIQDLLGYSKILDTLTDRFRHLEIVTDDNSFINEFKTRKEY